MLSSQALTVPFSEILLSSYLFKHYLVRETFHSQCHFLSGLVHHSLVLVFALFQTNWLMYCYLWSLARFFCPVSLYYHLPPSKHSGLHLYTAPLGQTLRDQTKGNVQRKGCQAEPGLLWVKQYIVSYRVFCGFCCLLQSIYFLLKNSSYS